MRYLRKVDVKSAVFSVPHSKRGGTNADNLHASTPLRRALSRAAGMCRIYIAKQWAGRRSRAIGRIGYHRNAGGRVARPPIRP